MSTGTPTAAQKKAALHAAVMAQLSYLSAMSAVEELYVADGTVQDAQSEALHDLVTTLAEAAPIPGRKPSPGAITETHIKDLDAIYA